jgi:UDP-N-acetylmuramate--alanine ligase
MKIGIFFGGPSREREISFAGGRTVYDNLDKSRFEALPIFVDPHGQLILLDWPYLYKGTIRDFYPPADVLPDAESHFQLYMDSLGYLPDAELKSIAGRVGKVLSWDEVAGMIDFAFLALHGEFGEDGQIQSFLNLYQIPYSGSGVVAGAIGMDKVLQKKLMRAAGFHTPASRIIRRQDDWNFEEMVSQVGLPLVVRPANQGSSIGVSILRTADAAAFRDMVEKAFFRLRLQAADWMALTQDEKEQAIRDWTDIRYGLGFPMMAGGETLYLPSQLLAFLENRFLAEGQQEVLLEGVLSEREVIVESFIEGREFSCIVLRLPDGGCTALPPTEIIKGTEVFDYRSKYLPGLSRKETPIQLDDEGIHAIRRECERLFDYLEFKTYARIDGFLSIDGHIILNDPNTTSGMMPSSFFFHQAAEIGLNPSQFLTYLIYISLYERDRESLRLSDKIPALLEAFSKSGSLTASGEKKKRIAVIMGGYSFERHISMESGRNIFEKLASSADYEPIPVFLAGAEQAFELYLLPIHLMLKDNADDIAHKIKHFRRHAVIDNIRITCGDITRQFAGDEVIFEPVPVTFGQLADMADAAFIALHGRPGEDGAIQAKLEEVGLPYNGSGIASSSTTIDKYRTLQTLASHGFHVARQKLLLKSDYVKDPAAACARTEAEFSYPLVAKPVDDGCSSAVKVIRNRQQMCDYLDTLFRDADEPSEAQRQALKLAHNEEFPKKPVVLIEEMIQKGDARHFLEVTGGMYTRTNGQGQPVYEVFEASEALSGGEVLSLEEKFLAGEGQNITPARYDKDPVVSASISKKVKETLKKAAMILGVEGYCRIDAFVKIYSPEDVRVYVIEVNSLPGMTPATCIFHQAALEGLQPHAFIDKILAYGMARAKTGSV